jgi:hypothetical protein
MIGKLAASPMALILATIDARTSILESIARFREELDGDDELIVVDASRDGTADLVAARFPDVRLLRRPAGGLAPELWRDGLDATNAGLVAFSTAQMVPASGWRRAMLDRLEATGAAAVGGPIEPGPGLSPHDRAVYLLRYVNYLRPFPAIDPARLEPPGDNAIYRRDRLSGLESLWRDGFWEVEVHRALRARGETLALARDAAVAYRGGARVTGLIKQRYDHAHRYGAGRSVGIGRIGRLTRIGTAPIVPPLMLRRIVAALASRGQSLTPWIPALPYLFPLLAAWSLGEARGMASGRPKVSTKLFVGYVKRTDVDPEGSDRWVSHALLPTD